MKEVQRNAHTAISQVTGAQYVHTLRTVIRGRAKDSGVSSREGGGVCACTVRVRVFDMLPSLNAINEHKRCVT